MLYQSTFGPSGRRLMVIIGWKLNGADVAIDPCP